MLLIFFTAFFNAALAITDEFEFMSPGTSFVLNGIYEKGNFSGEFWLCVDYDSNAREDLHFSSNLQVTPDLLTRLLQKKADTNKLLESVIPNPYPSEKCGGKIRATNNPYWYALHGVWKYDRVLEIRFVSAFEVWSDSWSISVKAVDHKIPWNSDVLKHRKRHSKSWKLIQTHGQTCKGLRWPTISTLNLVGSGKVDVMAPTSSKMYVRLNGVGVRVNSYSVEIANTGFDPFSRFYERLEDK